MSRIGIFINYTIQIMSICYLYAQCIRIVINYTCIGVVNNSFRVFKSNKFSTIGVNSSYSLTIILLEWNKPIFSKYLGVTIITMSTLNQCFNKSFSIFIVIIAISSRLITITSGSSKSKQYLLV